LGLKTDFFVVVNIGNGRSQLTMTMAVIRIPLRFLVWWDIFFY